MSRIRRGSPTLSATGGRCARSRSGKARAIAGLVFAAALSGCQAPLEIFSTASDDAERVSKLGWFMIILSGVIFIGVMITMLVAAFRNRSRSEVRVDMSDPGPNWLIWGGAVMPGIVLITLFVVSMTAMGRFPMTRPVVTDHVTGEQWWWQLD